jgi:hypothetical protein
LQNYAPFDWLFGTFAATEEEFQKIDKARKERMAKAKAQKTA